MKREEIWSNIEKLSELRSKYSCFDEKEQPFYHALSLGIKGIKALPILDKIKAELDLETRVQVKHYTNTDDVIDTVLDIIDKYKLGSEG